ncbi:hypothetical protein [Dactylosporangium darangshiense]|uniref:Uncharacterized protein n=1 Tax=Dactylosporangium darangshiense TaxID=579108 RepID=A0ABP8DV29_9ACTN
MANEIETLRIMIIGCLVVVWAQLMVDLTVLLFLGGAQKAAAEIAAARAALLLVLRRAIIAATVRVAESVLAQVGFTLLAQVIELAQRRRRSLDGGQLRTAAINGAVGGAVGVGAGFVGGVLRAGGGLLANKGFGKPLAAGLGKLPGNDRTLPVMGKAVTNLVWNAGYGAVAGMAEGAAQDAVFKLAGDWVSGAANVGFNGAWAVRHCATNPRNKLSMSPADHLQHALDRRLDRLARPKPTAARLSDSCDDRPPRRWAGPPADIEGHEVWQDARRSNDDQPADRPPASQPHRAFSAEDNPWVAVARDRDPLGPPRDHLLPPLRSSTIRGVTRPIHPPPPSKSMHPNAR